MDQMFCANFLIKFKYQCNQILSKYVKKKTNQKSNLSLFFGSATGVCIQALEEGTNIIHFPNNEKIDVFSNKFWPSLKIKRIGDKGEKMKTIVVRRVTLIQSHIILKKI